MLKKVFRANTKLSESLFKKTKKGNFMLKSNSNKIILSRGGGKIIFFQIRFKRYSFLRLFIFFLSELNNIFHVKGLIRINFYVKLGQEKYLTRKILSHLI